MLVLFYSLVCVSAIPQAQSLLPILDTGESLDWSMYLCHTLEQQIGTDYLQL